MRKFLMAVVRVVSLGLAISQVWPAGGMGIGEVQCGATGAGFK